MPRTARIVIPGAPHHVTQRGNNQQDVFFVPDDRDAYLTLLKERCTSAGVRVLGYCLMTNHIHLVVLPATEAALATALGRTHFLYTQYINRHHGRSGHLWQNRFYSCPLDDTHAWTALRYVERNPVHAGLVRLPWRYPWSSAAVHVGEAPDETGVLDLATWKREWTAARWRTALREPLDDADTARLSRHLHTGRPLVAESLLSKLEHKLGRRLRPLAVGRPKRKGKYVTVPGLVKA